MTRLLSGRLEQLQPTTLLRVLGAVAPTGVLDIEAEAGTLHLEVSRGRVPAASDDELEHASLILSSTSGEYRFTPCDLPEHGGITLPLAAYAEAAATWAERRPTSFSSELDLNKLVSEDLIDFSKPASQPKVSVLPRKAPENPLDDLLSDLESTAPGELLFAQVGVVGSDPRLWRGTLEHEWRQRGWRMRQLGVPTDVELQDLDVLVIHHRLSITRVGQEDEWLALVERAESMSPPVPVVWIGPLGDPAWVHRLIQAGVAFLLPAPPGETGETLSRLVSSLTRVVDRQLIRARSGQRPELPDALSELMDSLLDQAEPERTLGTLLQLAAGTGSRGAVLLVEETAIRCRAGFGYPLMRGGPALPRGVAVLERVIRSRKPAVGLEPDAAASCQLARVLGVERLPAETAVIPLGAGDAVVGVLIIDREGDPLPDLEDLALLVGRLGGVVVQACPEV